MRVRASRERERGRFLPAYDRRADATGDLHLTYRTSHNRRVPVLQLLGADKAWPSLFDARLVELSADRMRFVGYEPNDRAWYLQEWIVELLSS